MQDRRISEGARLDLKRPLGKLLSGKDAIAALKASGGIAIAVGDITTLTFLGNGMEPDIAFLDFICKREKISVEQRERLDQFKAREIKIQNPPGIISGALLEACKNAFSTKDYPVKIIVEGEEDLAVLAAIIHAPIGSMIAYGQPNEGMVVLEVDETQKERARRMLAEAEVV
ncbi:MAG: GTP-dependent dephospho-CoA kinase family protein [Candidatus Micrarchaeota archaeon]